MAAKKKAVVAAAVDGPSMAKARPVVAPFKACRGGVRASGTVSELRRHPEGGKHVRVTIRHTGPKKEGEFEPYDAGHETTITMPAHLAKRFPFGKKVAVHVMPHGAMGTGGVDVDERGDEDEDEGAEPAAESAIERAYQHKTKKGATA